MSWLRAAASEIAGLFVTGWVETAAILGIVVAAWVLAADTRATWAGFGMAGALIILLLWFTQRDAARRRR